MREARSEVPLAVLQDGAPSTATSPAPTPPPAGPGADTGQQEVAQNVPQNTASAATSAPMGECSTEYRGLPDGNGAVADGVASVPATLRKVSLVPLVFLIFYEVSGGPFGIEDSVGAAGPLLAIAGFLLLPVIWSIPEALITAELGTMFPENGGYVVWVASALGPYWGFQQGWMKWLSGVIDNALYPVLFLDYLKSAVPALGGGPPRAFAVLGLTVVLTLLNYRGLTVVGWVAICLGVFSVLPFFVMGLISLPKIRPARWLVVDLHDVDWNLYLNTLFWNLNYWDSASTMAGEVEQPERTFPRALAVAVVLIADSYLLPLMAATGATDAPPEAWANGYLADAAGIIGGSWLKCWIEAGAVLSSIGMFEAQLSSGAYQLLGMADLGLLPSAFARRAARFRTPWVAIAASSAVTLGVSFLGFDDVVATANFLYSLGTLLEFAAFLWLRARQPDLKRPYRVPLQLPALAAMCAVPSAFLVYVCVVAGWRVFLLAGALTALGVGLHGAVTICRSKKWLRFNTTAAAIAAAEDRQGDHAAVLAV